MRAPGPAVLPAQPGMPGVPPGSPRHRGRCGRGKPRCFPGGSSAQLSSALPGPPRRRFPPCPLPVPGGSRCGLTCRAQPRGGGAAPRPGPERPRPAQRGGPGAGGGDGAGGRDPPPGPPRGSPPPARPAGGAAERRAPPAPRSGRRQPLAPGRGSAPAPQPGGNRGYPARSCRDPRARGSRRKGFPGEHCAPRPAVSPPTSRGNTPGPEQSPGGCAPPGSAPAAPPGVPRPSAVPRGEQDPP